MKTASETPTDPVAPSASTSCSPLLGRRVRAIDGTEGTVVEVAKTPRLRRTVFHVRTDDEREAALFSHEFEVIRPYEPDNQSAEAVKKDHDRHNIRGKTRS